MSAAKALSPSMGGHALVIGGSMAGLFGGRVLADHFERVTIVERDRYPEGATPRKGVLQARHLHALLARGQVTLEELFRGFRDELVAAGALVLDMADDVAWLTPAGWGVRFPSDLPMLACSRDLLDWGVRRRMAALSNVRFMEECDVRGLLPSPEATGVGGMRIRPRGRSDGSSAEEELFADLVVDAAVRGS
jgi:2-polyprenyl-6-methoxyphenol hydroxylase-like FAD-dependent oxidoreductase